MRNHPMKASLRTRLLSGHFWIFPSFVVFSVSFAIYGLTLAPTVTGEDSGELITAAYGLGVPHPPGYPLWTILAAGTIRAIPLGGVAYRVNLLSAVLAALAAAVLYNTVRRFFSVSTAVACLGSICFALGLHLWSQAIIAEVYTLHILLTCLILFSVLSWWQSGQNRHLYLTAFLSGLALTNHHLAVLLPPVLLLFVLVKRPRVFLQPRMVIIAMLLFVVGLLPYLYLPLAAKNGAHVNWGCPDTWQRFVDHVLRKQYGDASMKMPHTLMRMARHWKVLGQWNVQQYTGVAVPLICVGFLYLLRKSRTLLFLTAVFFLMHSVILAEILNFSFDRQELYCTRVFLLPSYLVTGIWLIIGCHAMGRLAYRITSRSWCGNAVGIGASALILILVLRANYHRSDMSNYYYAEDHATNILNALDPKAVLIPSGDHNTFPVIYEHCVEKVRPDIVIADKYGYIEYDLYASMPNAPARIRTRQERNEIEVYLIKHSGRPVYYTVKPSLDLLPEYEAVPQGLVHKVSIKGQARQTMPATELTYRNLKNCNTVLDHAATVILSDYHFYLASVALSQHKNTKALEHIRQAARLSEGLKEEMNNLGTLLAESGQGEEAIVYFEEAAKLDPKYITPRWNLAHLFKSQGDVLHAIQVFNDLATIDPGDYRIPGELGFLLRQYGETELALKNWGKSLSLNPNQLQVVEAIAQLHQSLQNPPAAASQQTPTGLRPAAPRVQDVQD